MGIQLRIIIQFGSINSFNHYQIESIRVRIRKIVNFDVDLVEIIISFAQLIENSMGDLDH